MLVNDPPGRDMYMGNDGAFRREVLGSTSAPCSKRHLLELNSSLRDLIRQKGSAQAYLLYQYLVPFALPNQGIPSLIGFMAIASTRYHT